MDKIAILIPCYNEAKTIAKVVSDFKREIPEAVVYVYDNNSSDETAKIAQNNGAIVRHEYQQGKGNVIRRMFAEIDAECYVMVDGDDTYPAEYAREMCEKVLKDVTFGYDEHVVLDHLNLKVMDAEQVTLAGRTGAGKSTILKLLLGLYEPQGGEVLIHGRPAVTVREEEKRKLFGYVEQTFHMVPGTVRDQITLYDENIPADRVKAVAELIGLDDVIENSENGYDTKCTPELFSQGQWQLLSIARAAVAEPQMLLFDEITANLDAETEKAVLLALKRVAKDRTVISISHRTSAELGRIIYL